MRFEVERGGSGTVMQLNLLLLGEGVGEVLHQPRWRVPGVPAQERHSIYALPRVPCSRDDEAAWKSEEVLLPG